MKSVKHNDKENVKKQRRKRDRAKNKCPNEIAEKIELIKLIPHEINLDSILEMERREKGTVTKAMLWNCLHLLPDDFLNYIFSFCKDKPQKDLDFSQISFDDLHRMRNAYQDFYETWSVLCRITTIVTKYNNWLDTFAKDGSRPPGFDFETFISPQIKKYENNIGFYLEFESPLSQFRGIRIDLLRFCDVCNQVFWKKRIESKTCSAPCLKIHHQREYRKKNREEINNQRNANYAQKKKVKEMKENKK